MKLRRSIFTFLVAPVLAFQSAAFAGYTLEGGVTVNGNGGTVGSGADTTLFYNGVMAEGIVQMNHRIAMAGGTTVASRVVSGMTAITDYLTGPRQPNKCYRGDNQSSSGSLFAAWQSPNIYCAPPACDTSPILLDLALNGFRLSGAEPPVEFDLSADGTFDLVSWTSRGSDDSFLGMDRNLNGRIDDGTELFGHATPLATGEPAGNGFRALGELDSIALGGNGDGRVDRRDTQFASLLVWTDFNRDGLSQTTELRPLSTTNVRALEYSFIQTDVTDSFGNVFWLQSTSWVRVGQPTGLRAWPIYDVMFVRQASDVVESCLP